MDRPPELPGALAAQKKEYIMKFAVISNKHYDQSTKLNRGEVYTRHKTAAAAERALSRLQSRHRTANPSSSLGLLVVAVDGAEFAVGDVVWGSIVRPDGL